MERNVEIFEHLYSDCWIFTEAEAADTAFEEIRLLFNEITDMLKFDSNICKSLKSKLQVLKDETVPRLLQAARDIRLAEQVFNKVRCQ